MVSGILFGIFLLLLLNHRIFYRKKNFASGIELDKDAVFNAMTLQWSNGQVEGNNNRIKMLKRQMYGRAKFDLLRARILFPT